MPGSKKSVLVMLTSSWLCLYKEETEKEPTLEKLSSRLAEGFAGCVNRSRLRQKTWSTCFGPLTQKSIGICGN